MLEQTEPRAYVYNRREGGDFFVSPVQGRGMDGVLELQALGIRLPMARAYADIPMEPIPSSDLAAGEPPPINDPLDGVADILMLAYDGQRALLWLNQPNAALDTQTPLQALCDDRKDAVIRAAVHDRIYFKPVPLESIPDAL